MIYRQGDVLIMAIDSIPQDAQPMTADNKQRYVLAEGEATGHAHALKNVDTVDVFTLADALFIRAGTAVEIVHEEHATVTLPAGLWQVVRQFEYTPQAIRRVFD